MQRRLILSSLFSIVASLLVGLLLADQAATGPNQWPVFRGNPLQSGVTEASLPETLTVRWRANTADAIEGAAAIADGVAYVPSQDGHVYAFDLATGQVRWKYQGAPFKAAPGVRDGVVYVGDGDGVFHSIDARSGHKRWTFATNAEIVSGANFAGDRVLFGSFDEHLYCLDRDGKLVWKFRIDGPVNGSPAIVGDRTFVAGCDSVLHILDLKTGRQLASVDLEGQAGATAAVLGDHLYVGTMSNQVLAIHWKKPEVVWKYEAARRQQPFYASAAVTDSLVVVGSRDKRVHALDRRTGREVWTFATEGRVDSSPVVVGNRVVVGSLDGHLYVLDLAQGTLRQKLDLGGPISASPAVVHNALVIGTEKGVVYCLGGK
ncbi:MAG: PQQ-binding-like beta-propeller repeat protein [Gemmataceae bacterium]|nr:PQQ-binding-like beta-propeller repeat protein [Gemmataceae bacterium]MDW8266469.1 PQQ-binding-like beta-propeller repeat protein [Gemmataceae bacterium]